MKTVGSFKSGLYLPWTSIFWTLGRILWILDFASLGAIMFAKLGQTLFQHFSWRQKPFGLFCFDSYLPRISGLWTLVKISWILDFTCLHTILFSKVAQTLFQNLLGK